MFTTPIFSSLNDRPAAHTDRDRRSTAVRMGGAVRRLAIAAAVSLAAGCAVAAPLPDGTSRQTAKLDSTSLETFSYRPAHCEPTALLLVFHGLHRNAPGSRDGVRAFADANCMLVVAPIFDKERFPSWRYQLGGIAKRGEARDPGEWTGNLVLELVEWARRKEGRRLDYFLLGHSAGAQFLSRVAAFVPTEARRIVIANPSTHVAPSLKVAAPFGLGGIYDDTAALRELRRYLEQPVTIFLGEDDTGDKDLSETPMAMAQGATRLERGLNIYHQAKALAAAQQWAFNWRLVVSPGVGHSARKMFSPNRLPAALRP